MKKSRFLKGKTSLYFHPVLHCLLLAISLFVSDTIINQFLIRHKVVYNGRSPNFKGLLFNKNATDMVQISENLSYKECPMALPKFTTFGLFILFLGTSTIMNQTACCHAVMISEICLHDCLHDHFVQTGFKKFD